MFSLKNKKILLTGGNGFLGGYVVRKLVKRGVNKNNILIPRSQKHDLRKRSVCDQLVKDIDIVIHLAAKVGGIQFNREHSAEVFYDNAAMALNLLDAAYQAGVEKFVGIGSVCSYPKFTPQPFREKNLWNGYPEESNAPYGLAKKMMLVQSQAYNAQYGFNAVHLLLVNLYGPGDNFNPESSHVIAALIKKVYEAKKQNKKYLEAWGTGKATREFLYAEDAAEGIVLAAEKYNKPEPVNIGSGMEVSIKKLIQMICHLMNYKNEILWDTSKPDGQPRRILDTSKAKKEFGFTAKTELVSGLKKTIKWYEDNLSHLDPQ
jgi:GDP-L-fucose synthase